MTGDIRNWVLFLLWLSLSILSGAISSLFSSSHIGHLLTWGVSLSVSYLFAFSYCSWVLKARMNVDILGISELKWTGMGEFNSDDHFIFYCGQEPFKRNGVAIMVNKRV